LPDYHCLHATYRIFSKKQLNKKTPACFKSESEAGQHTDALTFHPSPTERAIYRAHLCFNASVNRRSRRISALSSSFKTRSITQTLKISWIRRSFFKLFFLSFSLIPPFMVGIVAVRGENQNDRQKAYIKNVCRHIFCVKYLCNSLAKTAFISSPAP